MYGLYIRYEKNPDTGKYEQKFHTMTQCTHNLDKDVKLFRESIKKLSKDFRGTIEKMTAGYGFVITDTWYRTRCHSIDSFHYFFPCLEKETDCAAEYSDVDADMM